MDSNAYLVQIKGKDKTNLVEYIDIGKTKTTVKYRTMRKKYLNPEVLYEVGAIQSFINSKQDVIVEGKKLNDIVKILVFSKHVKLFDNSGREYIVKKQNIEIKNNNNNESDILKYYKELSKFYELEGKKSSILENQYNNLNYSNESVLKYFLNGWIKFHDYKDIYQRNIYPFEFNVSQKEAVENVYKANFSIIKGPPGTGKTQTILNLISNLAILQGKKVAIVSNNNKAIINVYEKLQKEGYEHIVASLGKKENVKDFFENIPKVKVKKNNVEISNEDLLTTIDQFNELLKYENKKQILNQKLSEYILEQKYFLEYYEKQDIGKIEVNKFSNMAPKKIIEYLAYSKLAIENQSLYKMLYKLMLILKFGKEAFKYKDISYILTLQKQYYINKINKIMEEIKTIELELEKSEFESLKKKYIEGSKRFFENKLYEINEKTEKYTFSENSYKNDFGRFVEKYPVILSTTYSLKNCIPRGFIFDYIIVDESSQVDLMTALLAMSCTKNIVIVGDEKQLTQIPSVKVENDEIKCPDEMYNYFSQNLLTSTLEIYNNSIPEKILYEHYRCNPKIINFCNRRYYDNKLILYENENHKKEEKPLIIYKTAPGNHMRYLKDKGRYNQREIDIILEEIIKNNDVTDIQLKDIGICAPYNIQVDKIKEVQKIIDINTVHKYQGKEKELMIMSTVLDETKEGACGVKFVDDPHLVNVAVSRAKNKFILVTTEKIFLKRSKEIKALINYIKYETFDNSIIESEIVSAFDLLYKEYSPVLNKLKKIMVHNSKFDSENIVETLLINLLKDKEFCEFICERQILLKNILKETQKLSEDEEIYVNNRASIDFVIYGLNKMPVLLIEVDGVSSHDNNPKQLKKDAMKNSICQKYSLPLLRLKKDKSGIYEIIKRNLREVINKEGDE